MRLQRLSSSAELELFRESIIKSQDSGQVRVTICGGTGCRAFGSDALLEAFVKEIKRQRLSNSVNIKRTGCHGFCERGPVVVIQPRDIFYQSVTIEDVQEIVDNTLKNNQIIERLLYADPLTGKKIIHDPEVPFYAKQMRLVLAENGKIDPTEIIDYIAYNGYAALSQVLTKMKPEQVIDEVEKSGLRGRGGAGFPTGTKWKICRGAAGDVKYVICNADEGDPGAFMDRSVLEGNPHKVLEGMLICGYAIGSSTGYVYVRAEYPLAVEHLKIAISQAKKLGLLGENILGSPFSFEIKIKEGAGAFVCGEETALMRSIEGKRGMPTPRPPFPAISGLWGKPTNINNVETFANVPIIIRQGAEWYRSIGTEKSKGTKIFSLTGRINNTGLVEVPMGTTLREVIYDIGGGVPKGRKFKAVQMGGPSGGCISSTHLDLPIEYESLVSVGAMVGSGGMIVLDENTCIVDVARFFLTFTQDESCGKCTPCRIGTKRMLEILTRITEGKGTSEDINLLRKLATVVKRSSLCGLGQTAPNPILSTLNYFLDEYEAHIKYKRCPAATCTQLVRAPCTNTCPASVDAASYIGLIAQGNFAEAIAVHRERNPFPAICGRVCHHPCEIRCRRGEIDEPIAIMALKRFMAEYDQVQSPKSKVRSLKPSAISHQPSARVAIVGSGPAGLSCAYQLALSGYQVTVFEALPVAGGMLVVGIPEYRLPKALVKKEIDFIKSVGVEIKTGKRLGQDFTIQDLYKQGYGAIFIAIGAHRGNKMDIPGEKSRGVIDGVSFLRDVNLGKKTSLGKKVAVIGGGDVAMDAARSALRLKAEKVYIIYRRSRDEMPAHEWDIKEAEEEGIKFIYLAAPKAIVSKNKGRLTGIKCVRMKLGERDATGRRRPIPIEGSDFVVDVDTVIPAIGQSSDLSSVAKAKGLKLSESKTIVVDKDTLMTDIPGIFAGGDVVKGPATVIEAIAQGQKAAFEIDKYLSGRSIREKELERLERRAIAPYLAELVEPAEGNREKMKFLPAKKRKNDFSEVALGFSLEQALQEAKRCLRCDLKEE